MTGITISIRSEDASIEVVLNDVAATKSPSGSFLLASAVTGLIEEADVDAWEKEAHELQSDEFYNIILGAVARHFARSITVASSEMTSYEALKALIDNLHEQGYLNRKITDSDGNAYYDES